MLDFEMPVYKLYLLFISTDAAQEKEKSQESAAAHWCFQSLQPIQYIQKESKHFV
jgi:hypothetical protein